jgi:putative flavoprotein involved in K+ transport
MNVAPLHNHLPVAIVGGGQAGLSMSYCLKEQGIDHLLFERTRIAHEWREHRWDSFCLVTPNWQCDLPGFAYSGDDPKGFMLKDEIVRYLESYAESFNPPLREGVSVNRVRQLPGGQFNVATSIGEFTADQVVVATGGYHTAAIPRMAERLPASIRQLHSSAYRNPQSLPDGPVLVIGTGQSGCQIAEDLHREGVQVHLSVGSAPRSPRKYRGRDAIEWLHDSGYYAIGFEDHPQKETVREKTNHYMTGRDGGREIDLRVFASEGMKLYGRVKSLQDCVFDFADDLQRNLDHADAVAESIKTTIDRFIESQSSRSISRPPVFAPLSGAWDSIRTSAGSKCRCSTVAVSLCIAAA